MRAQPSTLFGGWLPRYVHIERLGSVECDGLLDGEVIVQEKLDGANLTVARDPDTGRVLIASRNTLLYGPDSMEATGFNGAVEYVLARCDGGLGSTLGALFLEHPTWILRGEWLTRHAIAYPADALRKLYVFDVEDFYDGARWYVHPDTWRPVVERCGFLAVPELWRGVGTAEQIGAMAVGESLIAPGVQREGVVVKRYDFRNRFGRITFGKVVSADFRAKNVATQGATRNDAWEIRLAALATPAFVLKTIRTIEDSVGRRLEIREMPRVLETVWHDLVTEEVYGLSKKHKGLRLDFGVAKRAVAAAAREAALDYFNGQLGQEAA